MLHIFLVTLWLLPFSQSQETVSSIHPTSIPKGFPTFGTSIFIDGSGFSSSTTYTCSWTGNGAYTSTAQFISSTSLICTTPNVGNWVGTRTSGSLVLKKSSTDIATAVLLFEVDSSCLSEPFPWCGIHGDPHFKPFCDGGSAPTDGYSVQPGNKQLNLVTSRDGKFKVYGRTTPWLWSGFFNYVVSTLNAISVIGPGADGSVSPNITFDSFTKTTVIITIGGLLLTSDKLPYNINGISIGQNANNWYFISFPNKETVMWNAIDTVYIYLPSANYSQNVYGLCGEIDVQYNYCKGSNGVQYSGTSNDELNACGNTWVVRPSSSTNVPIPQPTPNPSPVPKPQPVPNPINVPNPQPIPNPTTVPIPQPSNSPDIEPIPEPTPYPDTVPNPQPEPTPYPEAVPNPETVPNPQPEPAPSPDIVIIPEPAPSPDIVIIPVPAPGPDIVIVPEPSPFPSPDIQPEEPLPPAYVVPDNFVSKVIKNICSAMFGTLEEVCPAGYRQNLPIYEATCSYDGSALLSYRFEQLQIDASIVNNPGAFFTNVGQLAETVFDDSTYDLMVSSVRAGIHDCFYQAQNLSFVQPVFDVNEFFVSLPGCSSYCKFPGSSCSSNGECQLSLTLSQLIALSTGSASTICMNIMFLIICLLTLSIWN